MNPIFFFKHRHIATIIPALFRRVNLPSYSRSEMQTHDGDFIHLDRLFQKDKSEKVIILLHGLEGSAQAHYIKSQAAQFYAKGFDIIAINFRTCSGIESLLMNKTTNLYHSGETRDLTSVIELIENDYSEISLIGFSLGGNVLLKYLGESGKLNKTNPKIKKAVAFSTPIDLESCAEVLSKGFSLIYSLHFMKTLRKKLQWLQEHYKNIIVKDVDSKKLRTFYDFDHLVTAPLHGFSSAQEYWRRSSSKQFLDSIQVPTLLVNAKNDPFLGKGCYLNDQEIKNSYLTFESPKYGGHVGFMERGINGPSFMDKRAKSFILDASSC